MTREQFLFQLEQLLLDLPQEEREEALAYYREYFSDAGPENEASVIEELGTPAKVAASIKDGLRNGSDTAGTVEQPPQMRGNVSGSKNNRSRGQTDKRSKWILIILVAVFTSPLWIGAVGALFGILVGVIAAVIGISIALAVITVTGVIGGVIAAIVGIVRLFTEGLVSGMLTFAVGMLLIAAGCLCGVLILLIFGKFVPWLLRAVSNLFHNGRRRRKEVGVNE